MIASGVGETPVQSDRPFVGRDAELTALGSWWDRSRRGREVGLVVVSGESGVGKTRLVEAFVGMVRSHGDRVLLGAATDHGFMPYESWMAALRAELQRAGPEGRGLLLEGIEDEVGAVPWLADLVDRAGPGRLGVPDERAVGHVVGAILDRLAGSASTLVVLEDVQWSDQGSVALLQSILAERIEGLAVLAVERRPTAARGAWHEFDPARVGGPLDRVEVARLDRAACVELARSVMGREVGAPLLDAIYRATDGNPLVVGSVAAVAARSTLGEDRIVERLPGTAASIWAERFRAVSEPTLGVLTVAAVAGTTSAVAGLVDVSGDADQVQAALCEAEDEGLVEFPADGTVRFTHALLREYLYGQLTATRRVRLHRGIARSLVDRADEGPNDQSAAIAHHWAESGATGMQPAAFHAIAAAQWSMRQGSREGARTHGERADLLLEVVARLPDAEADAIADRQLALGDLYLHLGHERAQPLLYEALAHYESIDDIVGMARVAEALLRNDPSPVAVTVGTELARRLVDRIDQVETRLASRLLSRFARALDGWPGDEPYIERLSARALELARESGDDETLAIALFSHSTTRPWTDERLDQIGELVELGRRHDHLDYLLHGLGYLHTLLTDRGDLGAARDVLAELLDVQRRIPGGFVGAIRNGDLEREALVVVGRRRAYTAQLEGRFEDQEQAISELAALTDQRDLELFRLIATVVIQSGMLAWDRGDLASFAAFARQYADEDPREASRGAGVAFVLAELGQLDDARTYYEPLIRSRLAGLPTNLTLSFVLLLLANTAYLLDDREGARLVEDRLAPFSGRASCFIGGAGGPIDLGLARCAAVLGEHDRALALLESALDWCTRWDVRTFGARVHLARAEILALTGAPGSEVTFHAEQATQIASSLGMAGVERRAVAFAAGIG